MSNSFLARLPLSRHDLDRDYLARESEESLAALAAEGRFVVLRDGLGLVTDDGLALLAQSDLPEIVTSAYLGRSLDDKTPYFVAVVDDADLGDWANLRTIAPSLSERDAGLFAQALAITNWQATHRFSPLTGAPTALAKGGWVLNDTATGAELFPRTDMAVIVGVTDAADRLLLGSNALWESNRYSLLAGFVEPGESLEAAVAREVFEESGIHVTDPVYLGSQPWPFPASLMLGFRARVDATVESVLTPDGTEILDLRWFSRDKLHASLGDIRLPGGASIARAIIEEWYGGPVDEEPRAQR
jgi:NAD+ diphosphatase